VTTPEPSRFPWWDMMPDEFKIRSQQGDFWSYVDVRDVAEAALLGLTAAVERHQAFLLAADDNRSQDDLSGIIEKYYAHLPWPKISKEDYIARNPKASLVDCTQAKQVLGWQPKYSQFDPESGYTHQ